MKTLLFVFALGITASYAQTSVNDSRKDLIANLSSTADYATFTNALNQSGLSQTLRANGPFTIFAPTDAAFAKVPSLDELMKSENKPKLIKLLSNHVLTGKYTAQSIREAIEKGQGKATFKTLGGGTLTAALSENAVLITDEAGSTSRVIMPDQNSDNGIIHIIDTVDQTK